MTAADAAAKAEQLLAASADPDCGGYFMDGLAASVAGLAYATLAVAYELGVPAPAVAETPAAASAAKANPPLPGM